MPIEYGNGIIGSMWIVDDVARGAVVLTAHCFSSASDALVFLYGELVEHDCGT